MFSMKKFVSVLLVSVLLAGCWGSDEEEVSGVDSEATSKAEETKKTENAMVAGDPVQIKVDAEKAFEDGATKAGEETPGAQDEDAIAQAEFERLISSETTEAASKEPLEIKEATMDDIEILTR